MFQNPSLMSHGMMRDLNLLSPTQGPTRSPVLFCSPDHNFYMETDSPSLRCNCDTNQLQSLAEDLESASESKISGEESRGALSSIPLGQRSQRVVCDYNIDIVPTVRNSSTDVLFIDAASHQVHTPSKPPQLPSIPERYQSGLTCPTSTCDLKTIEELRSIEDNLDDPNKDAMFSPLENSPILLNFTDQPLSSQDLHHDAVEVLQADYHETIQPPSEPPDDQAVLPSQFAGTTAPPLPKSAPCNFWSVWRSRRGPAGAMGGERDRERRGAPD